MGRFLFWLTWAMTVASAAVAQDFSALARIDPATSRITDSGDGVEIELGLSQGVPWRLFTLASPPRLVLDFQEVDWTGLQAEALLRSRRVRSVRFGSYVPGWSRLVAELAGPYGIDSAGMRVDEATGWARLSVRLSRRDEESFVAGSGAPHDPRWDLPEPSLPVATGAGNGTGDDTRPMVVVIDPGHGGIDPGAQVPGIDEKAVTLAFARELREAFVRGGRVRVVLTREDDRFVSLERRISVAQEAGADLFISLHADSLSEGLAHGATVHVLSPEASDAASARLAERHDRDEILSGVDLSGTDDEVTDILLDLARQETQPRTEALARALVEGMAQVGGPINRRPLRRAAFSVLKSADIPSVLIEIGFLSSPRDLKNLQDPQWRARLARGIRNGVMNWRAADLARRPLVRQ